MNNFKGTRKMKLDDIIYTIIIVIIALLVGIGLLPDMVDV
jgi:hypothetical protein